MLKQIRITSIMAIVLGLSSLSMPAFANMDGACKEDAQKLCGDVKAGHGAIRDCMKSHESQLSQACKDDMAEAKETFKAKREEMHQACQADIKQLCANVTPGEGREFACLKSYEDKLSAPCKEKMMKVHRGMHKGK